MKSSEIDEYFLFNIKRWATDGHIAHPTLRTSQYCVYSILYMLVIFVVYE